MMQLKNLRAVGRYKKINPVYGDTTVNIRKGTRPGYGDDWYFYTVSGRRVIVPESELRSAWIRQ